MIEKGCGETIQDNFDAIAQLSPATAPDRETAATPTATNVKLAIQLEYVQAYIKTLQEHQDT
jgi:hypothetical protein